METPPPTADGRDAVEGRVRHAARVLSLRTREYVTEASRETHLHDADIHAVGVLRAAEKDGRAVTAGDLGRELSLSPAAVTALVNRMERAGHLSRRRSAADGRSVTLHVNESAHEMSDAMFDPLVDAYTEALDGYDEDQLAFLADAMERLAACTREQARHMRTPR